MNVHALCDDVLRLVFEEFLDVTSVLRAMLVCGRWRALVQAFNGNRVSAAAVLNQPKVEQLVQMWTTTPWCKAIGAWKLRHAIRDFGRGSEVLAWCRVDQRTDQRKIMICRKWLKREAVLATLWCTPTGVLWYVLTGSDGTVRSRKVNLLSD